MYPYAIIGEINLYTIFMSIGMVCAIFVLDKYLTHRKVPAKVQNFYMLAGIAAIILGILSAGLVQSIYNYIETGIFIFEGMTFYGGLIGGTIVFFVAFFCFGPLVFKEKEHIKYCSDLFAAAPCCITIAHGFGRIGCLFAGCCYGKKTDGFPGLWMISQDTKIPGYYLPTQLYEAIFLFALFAVTTILFYKKIDRTFEVYLIGYGIWRFFIEYLRIDDRGAFIPGLTPSQWISIGVILAGLILEGFKIYKKVKNKTVQS